MKNVLTERQLLLQKEKNDTDVFAVQRCCGVLISILTRDNGANFPSVQFVAFHLFVHYAA